MPGFEKTAVEFLATPVGDPRLLPLAQELAQALRAAAQETEQLSRYRETRKRLPARPKFSLSPPRFTYTVRST